MDKKEVTEKILTVSHNEKVDELTDEQLARISGGNGMLINQMSTIDDALKAKLLADIEQANASGNSHTPYQQTMVYVQDYMAQYNKFDPSKESPLESSLKIIKQIANGK